jgi:hypothetical protein
MTGWVSREQIAKDLAHRGLEPTMQILFVAEMPYRLGWAWGVMDPSGEFVAHGVRTSRDGARQSAKVAQMTLNQKLDSEI